MAVLMFGFKSVSSRFLFAFALVCLTWNPTPFNYVDWMLKQFDPIERSELWPLVAFCGMVTLGGTVATTGALDFRVTTSPPAGAGADNARVRF